jgi:hypothetical protein
MGSNSAFDKSQVNLVLDSYQNQLTFNQKNQFQSPIVQVSPFARSVEMQKTPRQAGQAVHFRVMGGTGLESI